MLRKTPFVTTMAVLSLALGIGANAAVFSMFNQILVRPLPVHDPSSLVNLTAPPPKPGSSSSDDAGPGTAVFSYPMYRDLEKEQDKPDAVLVGMAAHRSFGANISARSQTLNGRAMMVSGSYFTVLGLQPALGRLIGPSDDRTVGESPVVVLTHAYWRARFGSDPKVIGEALVVNGQSLTIVGVAPQGFEGTSLGITPEVFVPITMREQMQPGLRAGSFAARNNYWVYVFARLEPGVSLEQARASINVPYHAILNDVEAPLLQNMSAQTMAQFRARQAGVEDGAHGQSTIPREARTPLLLLGCVAGFVLLIACANIANLLLARSGARAGEMAVRLSIGAGRRQLVTQLLVESCVLAIIGGAAGLVVAKWTLNFVYGFMPTDVGTIFLPELDLSILVFSAALALGTGVLFGLFPALQSTRLSLVTMLKSQSGQSSGGGRTAARFRTLLATVQVALSMALLVAAGLFVRSLYNVSRVNLGVNIEHVVTFSLSPGLNGYSALRSQQLFDEIERQLKRFPGVKAVSSGTIPILGGGNSQNNLSVEGFRADPDTNTTASYNYVGANYLHTLEIPLLVGRDFTESDVIGTTKVVIVNERFVKKFNLGSEAIGKHIGLGNTTTLDMEIVGVTRDATYNDVKDEVPAVFLRPHRQIADVRSLSFYVRGTGDAEPLFAGIRKMVAALDANLPVIRLRTLEDQFRENVFLDRMMTILAAAFAVLATLLAAIGLYGVLAYTVMQRTREIGVRMALGATPGGVRMMVIRQVGWMALIGCGIGAAGAIMLGRIAESLLYGLHGSDPLILGSAAIALASVALGAGAIPAHRASKVDPMRALRYE